jgi:hypothetical protein
VMVADHFRCATVGGSGVSLMRAAELSGQAGESATLNDLQDSDPIRVRRSYGRLDSLTGS